MAGGRSSLAAAALGAVMASGVIAGCGPLGAPSHRSGRSGSKLAQVQVNHEYPSPPAPAEEPMGASPTAAEAVRSFAQAYTNWDAATVAPRLRDLAGRSVGQARSAMELAAAQVGGDYELQRGGIANQGTVEAVAPLAGGGDRYVVVTRERTTAALSTAYQGLQPAWHVTIAAVRRTGAGRWAVSGWQPES